MDSRILCPAFISLSIGSIAAATGFVIAIVLWVLLFKRAKLYVGYNVVPGVGPFVKFRVGALTTKGKVKSFSPLTLGSLFGGEIGFIKDNETIGEADVKNEAGKDKGKAMPDGRVVPGGRVVNPGGWHSKIYADESDEPVGFVRETGRLRKQPGAVSMVSKGGAAVLLLLKDQYRPSAQDIGEPIEKWDLCFLSCLIFAMIFFFAGPFIHGYLILFPFLGRDLSFLLTAFLIWLAVWGGLSFYRYDRALGLKRLRDFPLLFGVVPSRLNRRTGIKAFDAMGALFCLAASLLFFYTALFLFPIAVVGFAAFVILMLKASSAPWPVYPRRRIPDVPTEPPSPYSETPPDNMTLVTRSFRWKFRGLTVGGDYNLDITVRENAVRDSRASNPSPTQKGAAFPSLDAAGKAGQQIIEHNDFGKSSFEVTQAVNYLLKKSKEENLTIFEEATNVLNFVQNESIPYCLDEQSKAPEISSKGDYFRYPIETIYDQEGDCDCKSILAASIFSRMGFNTVLLVSHVEGHAAVAVKGAPNFPGSRFFIHNGDNYYWCETTASKTMVGEMPRDVEPNNYAKYEVR